MPNPVKNPDLSSADNGEDDVLKIELEERVS